MLMLSLLLIMTTECLSNTERSNVLVDLSRWNNVDFAKVSASGIIAVVHKATEGISYVDHQYALRRPLAEKEGILWGAYHFATGSDPVKQADHFLNTVGNTNDVLLMLDVEERKGTEMTPDQAELFVNRIKEKTGRYPMLYGTASYLRPFNKENLKKCSLWVAHYTSQSEPKIPQHWSSWTLWQYTDGKVGGTPKTVNGVGPCDRNHYNGTAQQLRSKWPNL